MAISRREALCISGSTLAGLSLGGLMPETLQAQAPSRRSRGRTNSSTGRCVRASPRPFRSNRMVRLQSTRRARRDLLPIRSCGARRTVRRPKSSSTTGR